MAAKKEAGGDEKLISFVIWPNYSTIMTGNSAFPSLENICSINDILEVNK